MVETVEIGKISSRGQIAIPSEMRNRLKLHEGSKVIFFLENDTLLIKKVTTETFAQLIKPLRTAKEKKKKKEEVI